MSIKAHLAMAALQSPAERQRSRAFTLLELLITISILSLLAGMVMPLVGLARRSAMKTNTQSILATVQAGLGRFRTEIGAYPWHDHDVASSELEKNHLADIIWWQPDATALADQRLALAADLDQVVSSNSVAPQAYTAATVKDATLSRMANERGRLAVLTGYTAITGALAPTVRLVPNPRSSGWQADYLGSELQPRYRQDRAILDAYGNPLLYVCRGLPAPRPVMPVQSIFSGGYDYYNWMVIHPATCGMQAIARTPTTAIASDVRTTAAAAYIGTYEVWSAGPNGLSRPMRAEVDNADDVLATPYRAGLQ